MWVLVEIKLENNLFSKELWKQISGIIYLKMNIYICCTMTALVNQNVLSVFFLWYRIYQKKIINICRLKGEHMIIRNATSLNQF